MIGRKRRAQLRRWAVALLSAGLLGGLLAWPLVLLLWEAADQLWQPTIRSDLSAAEKLRTRSLEAFAAIWFFWLGASVGSFLNVVVYRVPRRISLVWRPSSCPYCARPIKARDNIPILGWLWLGGRCRSCRLPISARYPTVELLTAVLFLGLYFLELVSGGANLPLREPNWQRGAAEVLFDPQWDLIALFAYHAWMLCVLLTWALIDYDRQRIPDAFAGMGLVVGLVAPAALPWLHPVPWLVSQPAWWNAAPWLERIDTSVVGGLAGMLLGAAIAAGQGVLRPCRPVSHAPLGLALVGVVLGWQAAISVAVIAGGIQLLLSLAARARPAAARVPWLACGLAAACVQLAGWRLLNTLDGWPGHGTPAALMTLAVLAAVLLHLPGPPQVTPWARPRKSPVPPDPRNLA